MRLLWPLFILCAFEAAAARSTSAMLLRATDGSKPRVYAGAYLNDVSAFDLKAGEFKADLVVWCKWRGSELVPPIEFRNATIETRDEVARESDGDWRMVRWHVQGIFRGTFPLHRFPFDQQKLKLELGLGDSSRILVPDLAASGMAPSFSITGWLYEPFFVTEHETSMLASDLGSVRSEGQGQKLQSISLVLTLSRPIASYVLKFVLPLLIIIGMALLSFFLPATELEVRGGMVVTALLSCVAFHFAQADSLPDVSYLVAADKLFLASYVAILLALIATVVSFRSLAASKERSTTVDRAAIALLSMGVVISMSAILGGAYQVPEPAEEVPQLPKKPVEGPVLRVGVLAMNTVNSLGLNGLQRRGLSQLDPSGLRVPTALVEHPDMTNASVRLLPDGGMRVRWRLKPGLRFSDGAPITSKDVAFSLSLVPEPDRLSLSVIDERTVEEIWRERSPTALGDRTLYPAHVVEKLSADGGRDAVVQHTRENVVPFDGPFKVEKLELGKFARLVPNLYFAGQQPFFSAIEFTVYPSAEALAAAMKDGKVDFAPSLPISGLAQLSGDERFKVRVEPSETLWFVHPDLHLPALANPKVRRALLSALDRRAFAQAMFDDPKLVTDTYLPSIEPDHLALEPAPFEPDKARAELQAEGVLPLELPVYFLEAPAGSPQLKAIEGAMANLSAAGVTVTPKPVKTALMDLVNKGAHGGLVITSRSTTSSPARFFNLPQRDGRTDTSVRGPHFTDETARLLKAWEQSLFPERKESLSARLQQTFAAVLPVLPLCSGRDQAAYVKQLKGFAPVQRSVWWNVEHWKLEP